MKLHYPLIAVTLAVFGTATAADSGKAGNPKTGKENAGYRLPASLLVSCPVMSRIKLTEKQVAAVRKLETETNAEIADAYRQCRKEGKKKHAYYRKRGELLDALKSKVVDLLNAGQKAKHETGVKLLGAYTEKVSAARGEHLKAMRAARKAQDKARLAELREKYQEKVKPLKAELEKQLDEQVGKKPKVVRKSRSRKDASS